jgi:hypothetical protein
MIGDPDNKSKNAARREIRYPQLTELSMIYEGRQEDISTRSPELSPHGMFIFSKKEYPQGAVLKLRFRLSRSGTLIQTRGEVRYCLKGVGIGVEFQGISPEFVQAIEEEVGLAVHSK